MFLEVALPEGTFVSFHWNVARLELIDLEAVELIAVLEFMLHVGVMQQVRVLHPLASGVQGADLSKLVRFQSRRTRRMQQNQHRAARVW
jgi:hypothetical protein